MERTTSSLSRLLLAVAWPAAVALVLPAASAAQSPAAPLSGQAWSENAGWIDFGTPDGGAVVTPTHLAGFAWGPNVGWIKLGADGGGPYANDSPGSWGVNRDAQGRLSGFAWSETVGWIDFATAHGQLVVAADGTFTGYAWSRSLGWIHFDGPGYGVEGAGGIGGSAEIPTVGEWGLILLATLLAALGVGRLSRGA